MLNLGPIKKTIDNATPGMWFIRKSYLAEIYSEDNQLIANTQELIISNETPTPDAKLIANSKTYIQLLINEVEMLRSVIAEHKREAESESRISNQRHFDKKLWNSITE